MTAAAPFAYQPELPIFDPLEPRVLPQDAAAWFTINWLSPAGKLNRQRAFQLDEMETVLRLTAGQPNLYMSQCLLDRPTRRSPFVRYGTHAFVDLDTYRIPDLAGLSRDELAKEILAYCIDTATPPPSAIISSGRGIYGKWFWTKPVGREGIGRMMGVNRALVRRLDRFGADRAATDCTRVIRITGSEHTGAKRLVAMLHQEPGIDGRTITYDFDTFADQIAPGAGAEPEADLLASAAHIDREAKRHRGGRVFTREGWHWAIIEDCHLLARLRWGGIVPKGWRDIFCHVIACQLARIFDPRLLYHEIVAHARLILPADYVTRDLAGHCSTLMNRARRQQTYRYRKDTLIEMLRINSDEEPFLAALISNGEKRRRELVSEAQRRRAAGIIPREAWLMQNAAERDQPWRREGISRATWYRRANAT